MVVSGYIRDGGGYMGELGSALWWRGVISVMGGALYGRIGLYVRSRL